MPGVRPPSDALDDEALIQKIEAQVQKNNDRMAELQKIGTSTETPDDEGLPEPGKPALLSDTDRMKSGFADDDAIHKMVHAGYTDMHKNKAGDWVAKGPDGRWYSDSHGAAAFVERHLGDVPGIVGMGAGGALASIPLVPTGPGAAAIPGAAVAGAGAGMASGELLRQYLGQKLGVRSAPLSGSDALTQGAIAAAGEGAFQGLGKAGEYGLSKLPPAVRDRIEAILAAPAKGLKAGVAKVFGGLSGAGEEAARRTIERPDQILDAKKNIADKAAQAGKYIDYQDQVLGKNVSDARVGFQENHGSKIADTSSLLDTNADAMKRYAPNAQNEGPLSPEETALLTGRQKGSYATEIKTPIFTQKAVEQPQWKNSFQVQPEVRMSPVEPRLKYGAKGDPQVLKDPTYGTDRLDVDPVQLQTIRESLSPTLPKGESELLQPEVRANPLQMELKQVGSHYQYLPEKSLGSLQRTADELGKDVGPAAWKKIAEGKAAQRNPSYLTEAAGQYKQIKDLLHLEDPNLTAADSAYSDFAKNVSTPGVGELSVEAKQQPAFEKLAKAVADRSNENQKAAATKILGPYMDDVLDSAMAQRFKAPEKITDFLRPSPRRMLQLGLGAGSASAAYSGQPGWETGILGAGALLAEPAVLKYLLANAAKAAPGAATAARRGGTYEGARSIWSLFNQEKNDGSKD